MLRAGQITNGTELALLLTKHYQEQKSPANTENIGHVLSIFKCYPPELERCKQQFMTATINWSAAVLSNTYGSQELHYVYAKEFERHGDFAGAEKHYQLSLDSTSFANMLVRWSKQGTKSEQDLFIARTVFRYLLLNTPVALENAEKVLNHVVSELKLDTPLINFISFLLKIVQAQAGNLFLPLRQKYASELQRDPLFTKYLDVIGKANFGIEGRQSGGLLGSLLQSFFT